MCYVGLVYPRPRFGLLSRGEAVRGEPAQYISMRAPETTVVVPNGSHYRDSQYICDSCSHCTSASKFAINISIFHLGSYTRRARIVPRRGAVGPTHGPLSKPLPTGAERYSRPMVGTSQQGDRWWLELTVDSATMSNGHVPEPS